MGSWLHPLVEQLGVTGEAGRASEGCDACLLRDPWPWHRPLPVALCRNDPGVVAGLRKLF